LKCSLIRFSSSKRRLSASAPNGFEVDFVRFGVPVLPLARRPLMELACLSEYSLDVSPYELGDPPPWLGRMIRHTMVRSSMPAASVGVASWLSSRRLWPSFRVPLERLRQPLRAAAAFVRFRAPTAFSVLDGLAGKPANESSSTFRRP
jgi:hypothetical protein